MARKEEETDMSGNDGSHNQVPDDEVNPKELISSLHRMRGTHKRKITIYLKILMELKSDDKVTSSHCKNQIKAEDDESSPVMPAQEDQATKMKPVSVSEESYLSTIWAYKVVLG